MHTEFRQTLSINLAGGQQEPDIVFCLLGNTVVFDSFSDPNDVRDRNLIINNVSKSNFSTRAFNTKFSVNVDAKVSAVLHPGSVAAYTIIDKKMKQIVKATNKHPPSRGNATTTVDAPNQSRVESSSTSKQIVKPRKAVTSMEALSMAAKVSYDQMRARALTDVDESSANDCSQETTSPSPLNNVAESRKRPREEDVVAAPAVVLPQSFRMAPPPPSQILTATPIVSPSPRPAFVRPPGFARMIA